MLLNIIQGFPSLKFIDIIDILVVAYLFYELYQLVRKTNVMRIAIGIFSIYMLWKIVRLLQMQLLSEILGQFVSMGMIVLIVVFAPELRRFFLTLGTKGFLESHTRRFLFWKINIQENESNNYDPIIQACKHMSSNKTGALIVFTRQNELNDYTSSGEIINSDITSGLLETIFFKNTPLHDGAVIISKKHIIAARCILPVSSNQDIPTSMGLRHRSAIGITEQTDAVSVIVSEQTGNISFAKDGEIFHDITPSELNRFLQTELKAAPKSSLTNSF